MSLTTCNPWKDMLTVQNRMNRLGRIFDQSFGAFPAGDKLAGWTPAVDIFETEKEIVLTADVPGVKLEDVDIRVENQTLTLRGERKFEKEVNQDNYHRVERVYGGFQRSFTLPSSVAADQIEAQYEAGVLRVTMPKREESRPKQIKVNVKAA